MKEKRRQGRPSLDIDAKARLVRLTDEQWAKAMRQKGGASAFFRKIIDKYKEK